MTLRPLEMMRSVWSLDGPLSLQARAVASVLILRADNATGIAYPSIARIVREANVSKSAVIRAIAELELAGWLARERRRNPDGSPTTTVYRMAQVAHSAPGGSACGAGGCSTEEQPCASQGQPLSLQGTTVVPPRNEGSPPQGHNLLSLSAHGSAQGEERGERPSVGASGAPNGDPWGLSVDGEPDAPPETLRRPTGTSTSEATIPSPGAVQDESVAPRMAPRSSEVSPSPQGGAPQVALFVLDAPGPTVAKARRSPPAKGKAASGGQAAVAAYVEAHRSCLGSDPRIDGHAGGRLKALVGELGIDGAVQAIRDTFDVVGAYREAFHAARKVHPVITFSVFEAGQRLMQAAGGVEPACAVVKRALEDAWFAEHRGDLKDIAAKPNTWIGEAQRPLPQRRGASPVQPGPVPEGRDILKIMAEQEGQAR